MAVLFVLALLLALIVVVARLLSSGAGNPTPGLPTKGSPRTSSLPASPLAKRQTSRRGRESKPQSAPTRPAIPPWSTSPSAPSSSSNYRDDQPVRVDSVTHSAPATYSIPTAPREFGPGRWIPEGQPTTIAGVAIPGGHALRRIVAQVPQRRN